MILNNADNIMIGTSEVDKIYCGSNVVWERNSPTPIRPVPVEYEALESFDNEHYYCLNTLLRPQSGTLKFECNVSCDEFVGDNLIFGGFFSDSYNLRDSNTNWCWINTDGSVTVSQWNGGQIGATSVAGDVQLNTPIEFSAVYSASELSVTINGQTYSRGGMSVLAREAWIGSNGGKQSQYSNCSIGNFSLYWFKIYDDNDLVRDFVPVKRLSDDAYGLWDFVTEEFYPWVH